MDLDAARTGSEPTSARVVPEGARPGAGVLVALARAANTLFFALTATYCILTYSSFAYQQFIRPRVVASIAGFAVFHAQWHWLLLAVTTMTIVRDRAAVRGRALAWSYVAAMALVGVVVSTRPVLPSVENNLRGLWLACAFLVPPIWLATYDHVATFRTLRPRVLEPRYIVATSGATALAVWMLNVACVPFRAGQLGDFTTSTTGVVFGALTSLAVHLGVFLGVGCGVALAVAAVRRITADVRGPFVALATCGVAIAAVAIRGLVFAPLAFSGVAAWLLAGELALVLVGTWSAMALRLQGARVAPATAFDVWARPVPGAGAEAGALLGLAVLPVVLSQTLTRVEQVDWNFLVQNLCVVATWLVACAYVHRMMPRVSTLRAAPASVLVMVVVTIVAGGAGFGRGLSASASASAASASSGRRFVPEFVLDGYATLDPSYRLIRHALTVESPEARAFFDDLRANSLVEHVEVEPIDIDVVRPLTARPERPPHIFLFAIDSLRRDYLSPYNPTVTFTPAIGQFAAEEFSFSRAFTVYGGTGLSMPAIWSGSMLLHKEYVLPFARMNALEKLLLVNGYRLAMAKGDPITEQLVSPDLPLELIDQGKADGEIEFCSTLQELEAKLHAGLADAQPLMVHTRPMNLHVSKLTQRTGVTDPSFGAFHPAAAAVVQRLDGCFGRFVAFLKQQGLYDNSIVILTSDHGDSLGEAKRWGHSSTIFPEIVRVPLLVHVPPRLRERVTADVDAASYSTDLTPSIYALLGYSVTDQPWPQGRPLFVARGVDTSWRLREPAVVASSYGAVYGVLRDNGRLLYIADAVNAREYAYDLSDLKPVRIGVTAEMREADRALIRERLAKLASLYQFTPRH